MSYLGCVFNYVTPSDLKNISKDVKYLIDGELLTFGGSGIQFCECTSDKSGAGGKISRQSDASHTSAVVSETQLIRKQIFRRVGRCPMRTRRPIPRWKW